MEGQPQTTLPRTALHDVKRSASIVVQILNVTTGKLANAQEDDVGAQSHASTRRGMVRDGKFDAITPEGHRVRLGATKAEAAFGERR